MAIREVFTLLPYSSELHHYFAFSSQEITLQTHIYMVCECLNMMIYIYVFKEVFIEFYDIFALWLFLQRIELVEYFLTYNEAWGSFIIWGKKINIHITNIKIVTLSLSTFTKFITWKT